MDRARMVIWRFSDAAILDTARALSHYSVPTAYGFRDVLGQIIQSQ
jgi:hypothetical protein